MRLRRTPLTSRVVRSGLTLAATALGLLIGSSAALATSEPTYRWATKPGGSGPYAASPVGVAPLPDGSTIVGGYYSGGSMQFGSTTITSAGSERNVYMAKLNADGTWAWGATSAGGVATSVLSAAVDGVYDIASFPDGSAVVVGQIGTTSLTFGSTTLAAGNGDLFVARMNADGTWAWAERATHGGSAGGVNSWVTPNAVAALADGSTLVTGSFVKNVTFGSLPQISSTFDAREGFVAKIAPNGTWVSASKFGAGPSSPLPSPLPSQDPQAISVLADGSAVIAGIFSRRAVFGSTTLTGVDEDVFVAKLNADGATWAWATSASSTGSDTASDVVTLADGSAIVVGFAGSAVFGPLTFTGRGGYVAKVNANGTWGWVTGGSGTGSAGIAAVSALADGSSVVTGSVRGSISFGGSTLTEATGRVLTAKVKADGTWAWAAGAGGGGATWYQGQGVVAYEDGTATVVGRISGPITFGSTTLTPSGSLDTFAARYVDPVPSPASPAAAGSSASASKAAATVRVASTKASASGIRVRVRTSGAGRISVRGTYATRAARVACSARATVRRAGTHTLVCRFNATTQAVLAAQSVRVALRVAFTPTGGSAVTTSRTVTVNRVASDVRPVRPDVEPVTG